MIKYSFKYTLLETKEKIQKEIRCLIQSDVTLGNSHEVQSEFKYELDEYPKNNRLF